MTLPRRPKAVVFDLDGTLIDSEALVREAYSTTCREFGVAMSDAQFRRWANHLITTVASYYIIYAGWLMVARRRGSTTV